MVCGVVPPPPLELETVVLFDTVGAADQKAPSPGWFALIVQVPTATAVAVVPLTVHTEVVWLLNDTARLEVAVADKVAVAPTVSGPKSLKVMDCGVPVTWNVLNTLVAAR